MSYLVLARKYRPQSFEEVIGQAHVTKTLQNAIKTDRLAHALLFAGPRGVGKTSVARIVAKAMNCVKGPTPSPCNSCVSCKEITGGAAVDVLEIDGASNRGISEIRDLRENIKYMPGHSRFKIYIIDEVHMLTAEAFNALLKTLEEPPAHVLFLFATTEAHKIPLTILSRCQRHDFRRIGLEEIVRHLEDVCRKSSVSVAEESLRLIGREADGSMRDGLSLLDQVMAYSEGEVTHDQVLDVLGAVDRKMLFDMAEALLRRDLGKALGLLDDVYNQGHDVKRLSMQMVEHFRHLVILTMGHDARRLVEASPHELKAMENQIENLSVEALGEIFHTLFEGEAVVRTSRQPKLVMEMLLIKLAHLTPVVSFDEIIEKLDLLARGSKTTPDADSLFGQAGKKAASKRRRRAEPAVEEEPPAPSQDLSRSWKHFVAACRKKCPAMVPSLEKAALTRADEDLMELTVTGNSFHAVRLRDKKSMVLLQEVCGQLFKRKMKIRIVEAGREASGKGARSESDRDRRLKKEALAHPLVTEAVEIFRARVVDVKLL